MTIGLFKITFIIYVTILIISCTNSYEDLIKNNWYSNKHKYYSLLENTKKIFKNTDIKEITKNDIKTVYGISINNSNIKQSYPKYNIEIFEIFQLLKELNVSIYYGDGYVSFFIISGGVLESDYFIVYEEVDNSMINFINDSRKIGYTVLSQKKIDENWYLVNTD